MFEKYYSAFVTDEMKEKARRLPPNVVPQRATTPEDSIALAYLAFICEQEDIILTLDDRTDLQEAIANSLKRYKNKAKKSNLR